MTNFNSKETYLAARTHWKKEYSALSQEIRDARKAVVEAARAFSKAGPYHYGQGVDANKTYNEAWRALDKARAHRATLTIIHANIALDVLSEMKAEAKAQWEATRALA